MFTYSPILIPSFSGLTFNNGYTDRRLPAKALPRSRQSPHDLEFHPSRGTGRAPTKLLPIFQIEVRSYISIAHAWVGGEPVYRVRSFVFRPNFYQYAGLRALSIDTYAACNLELTA